MAQWLEPANLSFEENAFVKQIYISLLHKPQLCPIFLPQNEYQYIVDINCKT